MAHTQATPEHQRPTIEELRAKYKPQKFVTAKIVGEWENNATFAIQVTGEESDVDEAIESLRICVN